MNENEEKSNELESITLDSDNINETLEQTKDTQIEEKNSETKDEGSTFTLCIIAILSMIAPFILGIGFFLGIAIAATIITYVNITYPKSVFGKVMIFIFIIYIIFCFFMVAQAINSCGNELQRGHCD